MRAFPQGSIRSARGPAAAAAIALLSGACGSTATLKTRSGAELEARIEGGDRDRFCVTTEAGASELVRRDEVADIAHPGRVLIGVGGTYVALGLLLLAGGLAADAHARANDTETGAQIGILGGMGVLSMAFGAPLLAWGGTTHVRSRMAARPAVTLPSRCRE